MGHLRDMALFISEFFSGDPAIEEKKKQLEDLEIDYTESQGNSKGDKGANSITILRWFAPKPQNKKKE